MISYVRGQLAETGENHIVVEAGGIGYGINVPASVISELPPCGSEIRVYTFFSVREDGQSLYGFLYKEDREVFKSLLGVSGIGPKAALSILSVMRPDDLRLAVMTGDAKSISRAPGVGARTAQRIILELKDKVGNDPSFVLPSLSGADLAAGRAPGADRGAVAEAMEALTMLGYSRSEAGRAVSSIAVADDMTAEDILKSALKIIR